MSPAVESLIRIAAVLAASFALMAGAPQRTATYAAWQIEGQRCASRPGIVVKAWVSKSGKQGVGITLRARNTDDAPVVIGVDAAVFQVGRRTFASRRLPEAAEVPPGGSQHFYLPFVFDNNALWNAEHRKGRLVFKLRSKERPPAPFTFEMEHRMRSFGLDDGLSKAPGAGGPCRAPDRGATP